jgi:hypothetical protein
MTTPADYDDEIELARYVREYYSQLLTGFEGRVDWATVALEARASGKETAARLIEKKHALMDDAAVREALAGGIDAFRLRVCKRILAEHCNEVVVNRCPQCKRVARTPKARQCFRCGHDWHDSAD